MGIFLPAELQTRAKSPCARRPAAALPGGRGPQEGPHPELLHLPGWAHAALSGRQLAGSLRRALQSTLCVRPDL